MGPKSLICIECSLVFKVCGIIIIDFQRIFNVFQDIVKLGGGLVVMVGMPARLNIINKTDDNKRKRRAGGGGGGGGVR